MGEFLTIVKVLADQNRLRTLCALRGQTAEGRIGRLTARAGMLPQGQ